MPITNFFFLILSLPTDWSLFKLTLTNQSGIERKFNEQALNVNTQQKRNKPSLTTLKSLLNDWNTNKDTQNHKKLQYSLIQNNHITKTINSILHPRPASPLSLHDTNGNLTSDPNTMCQSMDESLIPLRGPPSFDIDTSLIDKVMTNSSKLPDNAPQSQFTCHTTIPCELSSPTRRAISNFGISTNLDLFDYILEQLHQKCDWKCHNSL